MQNRLKYLLIACLMIFPVNLEHGVNVRVDARSDLGVPLHPGTENYYREAGHIKN